jgi:hypothetical protein
VHPTTSSRKACESGRGRKTAQERGEDLPPTWHSYNMTYYSVIRRNEIIPFLGKWMELEIIMFSNCK